VTADDHDVPPRYSEPMTAATRVLILNGPNLDRLGSREPEVYGTGTLDDLRAELADTAPEGVQLDLRQTNDEAELIGWLHEAVDLRCAVILNPAAFTHYSYALRDAAALVTHAGLTLIEVHLSNPHAREEFRHTSVISGVATGVIAGFGFGSYRLALARITGAV
jgi:3-dehydroquinate dehydratase II